MTMLSRRALLAGLAAASATSPALAATATPPSILAKAMEGTATPGMTAMIIRDFKAEPEQVHGLRRLGGSEACAPGDRWHLGSNGKAMTATLIARLVERGALAWDRPLESLLPGLAGAMRPEYRQVTLPDLLSHHAGLPENHDDTPFFNSFYSDKATPTAQRLRYLRAALADAPIGPARAEPSYSNTGLLLAAAAAEQATGKAFESLITTEVFRPLGMKGASFDQYGGAHEPCGHVDGRVADRPLDANPRMFAPAGAMRMTMADWSRFCIDQLRGERGDGRLLTKEGYRFLHAAQGSTDGRGWALGWGLAPTAAGRKGPVLTHSGSDGNWFALVGLFPVTGNGLLVVANAADSMGGDKACLAAFRALIAGVAEPAA